MRYEELVDHVADKTQGTKGDPLSRPEVEEVVQATVTELLTAGATLPLDTEGVPEPE